MDTKLIVIISLVFGAISIFWGFLYPKFVEFQNIREEIGLAEKRKMEIENRVAGILSEIDKYENLSPSDIDLLDRALPRDEDLANLYVNVYSLLSSSGLVTNDIIISRGTEFSAENDSGKTPDDETGFYNVGITILAEGNYASVKDFVKKMESSLRIADVNSIVFSTEGAEVGGALSVTISAVVYYKP